MDISNIKKYSLYAFILLLGIIYFSTAPLTVQSGDTAELVTSSYFFRVPHPPGYPLWALLYHIPVRYLDILNPFHSAALYTSFLSIFGAFFLLSRFRRLDSYLLIGILFTSHAVWKFSIHPDVFALHALFLILVFLCFLDTEFLDSPWRVFLVALSIANHHTIVFVFPMFLFSLFQKNYKKRIMTSLLCGFAALSLYLLLLFFHPDTYGSWGRLYSIKDVLHHFLRTDYGTFQLIDRQSKNDSWILFFITNFLKNCWAYVLVLIYINAKDAEVFKREWKRLSVIFFCLFTYFLTFTLLGKTSFDLEGENVFEKFLIQPSFLVLFAFLIILNFSNVKLPKMIQVILGLQICINIFLNYKDLNFRTNHSVNDYLKNSFNLVPANAIYYPYGDTLGFGSYYLHDVEKVRPDIKLVHSTWTFGWDFEKFQKLYPDAVFKPSRNILESFNVYKYSFFTTEPVRMLPLDLVVTYKGLIYEIYPRAQVRSQYECPPTNSYTWESRPELSDFKSFEVSRYFDLSYGMCDFAQGLHEIKSENFEEALVSVEKAVNLSPYNARFRERLCFVYQKIRQDRVQECEAELEILLSELHRQYVFQKYE